MNRITTRPAAGKQTGKVAAKRDEEKNTEPALALVQTMQRRLLEEFVPWSCYLMSGSRWLQGPTIQYLEFPTGDPTHDLCRWPGRVCALKLRETIERRWKRVRPSSK